MSIRQLSSFNTLVHRYECYSGVRLQGQKPKIRLQDKMACEF